MWIGSHEMYSVCDEVGEKLIIDESPEFVSLWQFYPSEEETILEYYQLGEEVFIHSISNESHSFFFKDKMSIEEAFYDEVNLEEEYGQGDGILIQEEKPHEDIDLPIEIEREDI